MELDLNTSSYRSLSERLQAMHERIAEFAPGVDRIAFAMYDADEDLLKTFINSTREGMALRAYQYRLSDSQSLSYLARTSQMRLLDNLPAQLEPTTAHSSYVLAEGYVSSLTVPITHRGTFLGFVFFDSRRPHTFDDETVRRELLLHTSILAMAVANELLAVRSLVATVSVVKDLTSLRDVETGAHLERMSRYARLITQTLGDQLALSDEFVEQMHLFAPLHDIGKIAIPDRILLKPGRLDPDEWEIMKTHTIRGREIVTDIMREMKLESSLSSAVLMNIVTYHHEKLDGSGYPEGLSGEAVPLESRIVCVADIFDALTTARPYKPAWSVSDTLAELDRMVMAGQIDGRCVAALRANLALVQQAIDEHGDPQPG